MADGITVKIGLASWSKQYVDLLSDAAKVAVENGVPVNVVCDIVETGIKQILSYVVEVK